MEEVPQKEKRPVVYADAKTLLNAVLEARHQYGEMIIKVMDDGGKGFLKITMTIFPKDYCEETSEADIDEMGPSKNKRSTYGGTLGKNQI